MVAQSVCKGSGSEIGNLSFLNRLGPANFSLDFSYFGGAESFTEGKRSSRRTTVVSPSEQDDGVSYPGPPQDPTEFLWIMTEEPHRSRRMAIMKAHPEVTKLMGYEPLTKYVVLAVVSLQLYLAMYLRHTHPLSFRFLFLAYAVGGTTNQNLFLAIHEITHNLAFKGINANKALAVFANLPIGVPYFAAFKVCHTWANKRGLTGTADAPRNTT
jgi:sphingolipid delta-4 desaturase